MRDSCIVHQFNLLADLNEKEIDLLRVLERDARDYAMGEMIRDEGDEACNFFTVRSGWAYASRVLADGERQILDIFLPGQVMGLREVGFNQSLSRFVALTDVVACPFPKKRLTEIFDEAPRMSDLFFLIMAREQSMLIERIINIGRRPAAERLAHFIIEMKVRLNQPAHEFELPMNQQIIGDALGLSAVHISRTFKRLREDGHLSLEEGMVRIRNLDALVEFAGFNPTYLQHDSSWARLG